MRYVLLDTNIIIDYLSTRREHHRDAVLLMEELVDSPDIRLLLSPETVKDVYYLLRRMYSDEAIVRERIALFCEIVEIADLTHETIEKAFRSDEPDFEDALVRITAEEMGALAIVTRDEGAFRASNVPAFDAKSFLKRFV